VVGDFTDISFDNCNGLCSGDFIPEGDYDLAVQACTHQLDCYNRGGRMVAGKCAIGKCDVTDELCGSDSGPCPAIPMVTFPILQTCGRFPGNCRDEGFCQEGLEVCPPRTPASSSQACKEARRDQCTIDDCPDAVDPK
jgi:hypothetical protein